MKEEECEGKSEKERERGDQEAEQPAVSRTESEVCEERCQSIWSSVCMC